MDPSKVVYVTDGVHLYEVERIDHNFGLAGGALATVVDAATEQRREMSILELALCRPVRD